MLGKDEAKESAARLNEVKELAAELHHEWREREQEWPDAWGFEMPEDQAA